MEWSRKVPVCRAYILHEGQHIYSETLGAQSRVKKCLQNVEAQKDKRGSHKEERGAAGTHQEHREKGLSTQKLQSSRRKADGATQWVPGVPVNSTLWVHVQREAHGS